VTTLKTEISFGLTATRIKTADLSAVPKDILTVADRISLSDGTGTGQANTLFYDERTLLASTSEDLDLTGTLLDTFGVAVTNARIKALYIKALKTNTNNVVVGAAATNTWVTLLNSTGTITLRPGVQIMAACDEVDATGYLVTAATGDLLKIANSAAGSSVVYQIALIGASA
jgi:hypothetical protein